MKKNILVFLLTSFYSFGFAPDHLDGYKIKFSYGEDETSVIEFTELSAYEIDDETGANRELLGVYNSRKDGDTIIVTITGEDDANDVYTLNFITGVTGNGHKDDFAYLTSEEADETFELTSETNIYRDKVGSGKFLFNVLDEIDDESHTDKETYKIKFSYGEDETSVIEFHEFSAYEMDDETGANREFLGDYDSRKDGDTIIVTITGEDGANDVYTLNFITGVTGNGHKDDFAYLTSEEADETFELTSETNIYKDTLGSGEFQFNVLDPQGGFPITDTGHGNDDGHHQDGEHEFVNLEDVKTFVDSALAEFGERLKEINPVDARPVSAQKLFDEIDKGRFVYEIELNVGIRLFFDEGEKFLHAAYTNEYADHNFTYVDDEGVFQSLQAAIEKELSGIVINDAKKEISLVGDEGIYDFSFDYNNSKYEAYLTSDFDIILIMEGGDDEDDHRPVELSDKIKQILKDDYNDFFDNVEYLPAIKRPTPNGTGKEIVVFLDGFELIFNSDGTFNRENNPYKEHLQNMDAGLKVDYSKSLTYTEGDVRIQRLEKGDEHSFGSMFYNIFIVKNREDNSTIESASQLANQDTDKTFRLSFTYDVGSPRYFIVNGEVVDFKHIRPEGGNPGSVTISAKAVEPVPSASYDPSVDGRLSHTFGVSVEMGGERFYEGSIIETNVVNLDVGPASYSLPWDPSLSFSLDAKLGSMATVKANIPRRLLSGQFGIMNPNDVNSALVDQNGDLSDLVHEFIPYRGFEPHHSKQDEDVELSKIDFDGDNNTDSYLEVTFQTDGFPGEVQIGVPYVDPYANLDDSDFGWIEGKVTDIAGNPLDEYDVMFFRKPDSGNHEQMYQQAPVFFNFERLENGEFKAYLEPGSYYVEAFGFDIEDEQPFKPELFKADNGDPKVITIKKGEEADIELTFELEEEYRISDKFATVEGLVTVAGQDDHGDDDHGDDDHDEVGHVFFDLFPLDPAGKRKTEYPVYSFGVERGGEIRGEVPAETFEVEVFSPDNSLYLDSPLVVTFEAGKNKVLNIELKKRSMVTVSGTIKDSNGDPVWAEVVFVDPEDDENRFWPMPLEIALPMGQFKVKVPEGKYKILAERFDGLYEPTFYDGIKATAGVVTVEGDAGIDDIVFTMQARPTATVSVKLLENGDADQPVKYAWFDFFDAEDEFAPIVFPHLDVNFESGFDGTYTLNVPEGDYKLAIGAHNFEGLFRVTDETGSATWSTGTWDDGSVISLKVGETTDLGDVNMTSFGKSDAELYGFNWFDEGDSFSGSTVKGKVTTSNGVAVPKARIIAHTTDYLFWFDHIQSRSDGSFELNDLPEGEWVIFAEPPFDSESFRSFRESGELFVSLPDDAYSEGDNNLEVLELQESNVFGRVLFPKKNQNGETKNQGLGHAFVWVFRDEDQDGEPDWEESIDLIEEFGETDENGYFSFYLEEAGEYSFIIDLPGQLSALSPEPIGFTLKNPSQATQLGNAIRIDWKSDVRANSFDIQRKLSSESSYVSLFTGENNDSKPGARAKSFVDPSVKPGESYDYRVFAETDKGQIQIESSKIRISEPIIYLAPPSKTITGYVLDGNKTAIAGAEVVAWREEGEGWSSTFTGDDGSYELIAGPGKWEITVYRPYDDNVNWVYDGAPKRVKFAVGSKKESKSKNFTVSRMDGGMITGKIALPAGVSAEDLSNYVYIDAFDPEGRGNWDQPKDDGTFEIPLQPGQYELSLWIDPELKGFGSPDIKFVRVGKKTVDIGTLSLTSRSKTISGVVKIDNSETVLPNVHVWGWSEQGGWVSDTTNINGEYSLAVSPGRWEVGFDLPANEDGSLPPYFVTPPKRLRVKDKDKELDLYVQAAAATVSGVVYGPSGSPVSDLDAWVYAREFESSDDEYRDILAEVPLTSKGTFTFPGKPGKYLVGLWMPPGSDYGYAGEKKYTVTLDDNNATVLKDSNGTLVTQASFNLLKNDSVIKGSFILEGEAEGATGLTGEVYAVRVDGDGWQSTAIEDDGSYEMTLSAGKWALDYYIESDVSDRKIPRYPSKPVIVRVEKSSSLTQNFDELVSASMSISGKVIYDSNRSAVKEHSVYVWAYRESYGKMDEYWNEVETDENGFFTIPVLKGGRYEVGAILSQELREKGYLDSLVVKANLSSGSVSDLNLTITKPNSENFISGTILDPNGNTVADAIVYAWSDVGREAYVETDENGSYSLLVPNGVVWHVGAEYAEIDEYGSEIYFSTPDEVDVNLKTATSKSELVLKLAAPDFEIPDGTSVTFDPTKDFVTQLPDGTELTIPGGAANVDSSVTEVRIVITPTAKGLSKSADEKPADYGYSIELFDNKGKKVEGNFKKDVILSIPVDVNASIAKGMDINNVEAMYYSTTKDSWDKAKTSTWDKNSSTLTMTTDHFTTFAAVSTPDISDLSTGLAKIDDGTKGDWYTLDWLGYFYDASNGWIYHMELGWLNAVEGDDGNYWFYDSELGWLWTGPTYFYSTHSDKAYLYSDSESGWLYFEYSGGERKFYSYTNSSWSTPGQ